MRRKKQQLTDDECKKILEGEVRGVLSVLGDNGYPYGVPIDFWYNSENGNIYFHGAREGHKIDAIKSCDKVSFCVYDKGYIEEGKIGLNIKSVIVFGRLRIVEDKNKTIEICRKLSEKFSFPGEYIDKEIEKFAKLVMCLELLPEHITGKIINES